MIDLIKNQIDERYKKSKRNFKSEFIFYAIDVGSLENDNFGWWKCSTSTHKGYGHISIDTLCEELNVDLNNGKKIALGFEVSLFIPIPNKSSKLGKARTNEGSRAWSTSYNPLPTGLQQMAFIFEKIKSKTKGITFTKDGLLEPKNNLLIWEAFVSKDSKPKKNVQSINLHLDDAKHAVRSFRDKWIAKNGFVPSKEDISVKDASCMSLIALPILWSGISNDIKILNSPCIVINPKK